MTQPLPRRVTIVEVGPRDGLQNEAAIVPTSAKIAFVDALSAAGHSAIEVAAFVSPKWVPQMADAAAVLAGLTRHANVRYSALVPNLAGLTRAVAAGVRHIAIFAAASETFSKRNINQSVDESLETYRGVIAAAHERRIPVRGYLSTCFGCPFEGRVPPQRVAEVAGRLVELGVWQVAISDTIGVAHPAQVTEVLDAATRRVPLPALALHMHDTRGTALANVLAGLQYGVTTFDSAAGGLGGCPYAPGASGNLATEDLLYMLHGMGIETGVSLDGVLAASRGLAPAIGHPLPSKYFQAAGG
jgi:isopropylmalate/homocitrate/citramalate synthase